jgi:DNA-directed RNA polymerase specialized sigma24 family protein
MHMSQEDVSQTGDRLERIYDRFYPEVYRYLNFRLEDEQTCEDLASEVFVRLLAAWGRAGRPIHNLRGWLLGISSPITCVPITAPA